MVNTKKIKKPKYKKTLIEKDGIQGTFNNK